MNRDDAKKALDFSDLSRQLERVNRIRMAARVCPEHGLAAIGVDDGGVYFCADCVRLRPWLLGKVSVTAEGCLCPVG